eukprot:6020697-Ditylum_brightwellii.AAC.1
MQRNLNNNNTIGHNTDNKDSNHTRILFINPNGIAMSKQCDQHQELCDITNLHDIDYFGCPEIN